VNVLKTSIDTPKNALIIDRVVSLLDSNQNKYFQIRKFKNDFYNLVLNQEVLRLNNNFLLSTDDHALNLVKIYLNEKVNDIADNESEDEYDDLKKRKTKFKVLDGDYGSIKCFDFVGHAKIAPNFNINAKKLFYMDEANGVLKIYPRSMSLLKRPFLALISLEITRELEGENVLVNK
jgi:hypothetical protein